MRINAFDCRASVRGGVGEQREHLLLRLHNMVHRPHTFQGLTTRNGTLAINPRH